jgi:hypothetical protein
MVLKDGKWCPWEPQWPPDANDKGYGECCLPTKEAASACLADKYCSSAGKTDACCAPGKAEDGTNKICNEKCRFVTSIDGKEHLVCDIPGIGIGQQKPDQTPYVRPTPSPCSEAQKNCLETNPSDCTRCLPSALPECEVSCKDKTTNSGCTACCIEKSSTKEEKTKCLVESGCGHKP